MNATQRHRPLPFWRTKRGQERIRLTLSTVIALLGAALLILPFYWMISTALKTPAQVFALPPVWFPIPPQFGNFVEAVTLIPMHLYAFNTFFIVFMVMIGTLFSCSLSAYGFARFRAPGLDFIFLVLLATLMLPGAVTLVPTYLLFNALGWVNTFLPLIVPAYFGSAFFIFLMRQFYLTIPIDLEDAAKIDGANSFQIYWRIMFPLSKPVLATVAVFTFVWTYNDFFSPLIYLTDEAHRTIAVALSYFQGSPRVGPQMHILMAAAAISLAPPLIIFIAAQRYFVRGIVTTGIRG
ncbi:MAG: carbohydrate ABC transporter permease [Caldilinea sp.]|nr:carbohydrate ABC transporter permease [Caldilinea sp.]MDW8440913.1 carbohydrate ABC transporter permease [Caldilineaceae bacterium]